MIIGHYQQLAVDRKTPAGWRVTFVNPLINLDLQTLREIHGLVSELEASPDAKVVVFDSADPEFFLAQWDTSGSPRPANPAELPPPWSDISLRMANLPLVTLALIRGRARGMGSEIALAFDMRFASIERAIFGQLELVGLVPGGGAMERLPLLAGRARAPEIVLGAEDFDAATAERYGWINRALPDAQLDTFVANLAERTGSFDKQAIAAAKRAMNRHALPSREDLESSKAVFLGAFAWPRTQARSEILRELGLGTRSDLELRFGAHLPGLGQGS